MHGIQRGFSFLALLGAVLAAGSGAPPPASADTIAGRWTGTDATSRVTGAVVTTEVSVNASCTYPDIDPCDDNDGGWKGSRWELEQRSSAGFKLARSVPRSELGRLPMVLDTSSHQFEATMVNTSVHCTQTVTDKDGGVSGGGTAGTTDLEARFVEGDTTDPLDPDVELATGRSVDMDGMVRTSFDATRQPTLSRTHTVTSTDHEPCPPGVTTTELFFVDALDPMVDVWGTSDLDYRHTVSPQIRTVDCPDEDVCKVTILGGETWTVSGSAVTWGTMTGSKTVSWVLQFTVDRTALECGDDQDNDGDGTSDLADPGCVSQADASELGDVACDNGLDDDGNGRIDFRPAGAGDPGCESSTDATESSACAAASAAERHFSTLDVPARLNLKALPDPQLGTLHMGIPWCMTEAGPRIMTRPDVMSDPYGWWDGSDAWGVLGALETFGVALDPPQEPAVVHGKVSARVTMSLRANLNAVDLVFNAVPLGKLFKPLKKAIAKHADRLNPLARRLDEFAVSVEKATKRMDASRVNVRSARAQVAQLRQAITDTEQALEAATTGSERQRLRRHLAELNSAEKAAKRVERSASLEHQDDIRELRRVKAEEARLARRVDEILGKIRRTHAKVAGFKQKITKGIDDRVDRIRPRWARAVVRKMVDRIEARLDLALAELKAEIKKLASTELVEVLKSRKATAALLDHLKSTYSRAVREISTIGIPIWEADFSVSFDQAGRPSVADNSASRSIFTIETEPAVRTS